MKYVFILYTFLYSTLQVSAQVVTVTDQETGLPLEYAIITGNNSSEVVTTNAAGQVDLSILRNADPLLVRVLGYQVKSISQEELKLSGYQVKLIPEGFSLDQVVVSASKFNQVSREVPFKITSISSRSIALHNPQTSADLLGASGQVFIQKSQQGGGSPMIRGFAANRLLYVVDGVRMNTAIFRGGNIQNVISLDPFAMEQVEVLFGPGSVIYGSDAIGGVMTFSTLTPQLSFESHPLITGKAIARHSSANREFASHFDVSAGWKKWAFVSSISSNEFGDLRMGSYGPEEYLRPFYVQRQDSIDRIITNEDPLVQIPTGYSQINLMQKIRFVPGPNWDFQYGLHYSTTSDYARYDRHIRYRNGLPRYGEWAYGPQRWLMHHFRVTHHGQNKYYDQLSFTGGLQQFEESRLDRNIQDVIRHIRREKVDALSFNLDLAKAIDAKQKISYGVEFVTDKVNSIGKDENISSGEVADGPARYPQATWSSYAAYVMYQRKIHHKLSVNAGLRYNVFQLDATFDTRFYPFPFTTATIDNGSTTGSLGAVYHPDENTSVLLNVSTGFRSPNVDDSGKVFDSAPGSVVVPNPDLDAEYAYNAEIGVAKIFGKNVRLDLSVYYTKLDNALVRRDFALNGMDSILYDGELSKVQAIQNAAVATVYGMQAAIEIKLSSGFGFNSQFNYQKGEEELDDGSTSPSRHAAPLFGSLGINLVQRKLHWMLYAQYSARKSFEDLPHEELAKPEIYAKDKNGNPYSPSWYTLNFKANLQLERNIFIGAGLENITDRRYRTYSSGIVAPGRNLILSVRFDY